MREWRVEVELSKEEVEVLGEGERDENEVTRRQGQQGQVK